VKPKQPPGPPMTLGNMRGWTCVIAGARHENADNSSAASIWSAASFAR
jgi:hypothetical protein